MVRKYLIQVKPTKSHEDIITNYTFDNFLDEVCKQAEAFGFEFEVIEDGIFIKSSKGWKDKDEKGLKV